MKKENVFLNRVFARPALLNEPPASGRIWILDVLIALLLFIIANIPISLITTPFIYAYIFENVDLSGFSVNINSLDIEAVIRYIENIFSKTMSLLEQMPAWINLISLFTFAFIALAVIIFRIKLQKGTFYSLGFKKHGAVKSYASGLIIGFVIFAAAVGLGLITNSLKFAGFSKLDLSNVIYIILFLLGYFVQGMSEELLCRGFLLTAITRRYSVLSAVIINSVFFALLHAFNPGISVLAIINLFLFGVFASLVMMKTDNIWTVSAIHAIWNFTQGNIFGIRVSGSSYTPSIMKFMSTESSIMNGGKFGMEGGLCVTVVLLIGIVIFAFIKPKNKEAS